MLDKVVVFGGAGFIGRHLCRALEAEDVRVTGADLQNLDGITGMDVFEASSVRRLIGEIRPSAIINLVGTFADPIPSNMFRANVLPSLTIMEAIADLRIDCTLVIIGSAAEYGFVDPALGPVTENMTPSPVSQYGISKYAQTLSCLSFAKSKGLDLRIARPFNIIGRDMSPHLVPKTFLVELLDKKSETLHTGNLNAIRDYLCVDDVTSALHIILSKGQPGEIYNVCSATGVPVRQILATIRQDPRIPEFVLHEETAYHRREDAAYSVGDNSKLLGLGWIPKSKIEDCVRDLIDGFMGGD